MSRTFVFKEIESKVPHHRIDFDLHFDPNHKKSYPSDDMDSNTGDKKTWHTPEKWTWKPEEGPSTVEEYQLEFQNDREAIVTDFADDFVMKVII